MIVVVWLMDDSWVLQAILDGLSAMRTEVTSVTLFCDQETLIRRWKNDHSCEWRTDQWLEVSLASLPTFLSMKDVIDTSNLTVDQIADIIIGQRENPEEKLESGKKSVYQTDCTRQE